MTIGLFFGSFNPIHTGHLIIANHFIEQTDIEEVWFVVSPHNPLKKESTLLDAELRLKMVKDVIKPNKKFKVCDVEFDLPKPSYSISTLKHLKLKHPWIDFVIIMGSDSFAGIHDWKDYKDILEGWNVYVYRRRDFPVKPMAHGNITVFDFPYIEISSTYIRKLVEEGKSVQFLVPDKALKFLK